MICKIKIIKLITSSENNKITSIKKLLTLMNKITKKNKT